MATESAVQAQRAREYETIYILRPNAGEEAADKVSTRLVELVDREQGKLTQVNAWGRRRLAYKIRGHGKGVFYHLVYLGYPGLVEELERNLRMFDAVLKYQTVKLQHEVDLSAVEVDPEAIKFQGVDFSEEPEEEESVSHEEQMSKEDGTYGLDDYEPEPMSSMRSVGRPPYHRGDDDDDGQGGSDAPDENEKE